MLRLPIVQGSSATFIAPIVAMMNTEEFACPEYAGDGSGKGPSIKYVRKNMPIFDPLPLVRSAYALVWTPPCLQVRNLHGYIEMYLYRACKIVSFTNMFKLNYNMIFIKCKYIC